MKRWTSKTFGAAGENCRLLLYSSLLSHFRKCIRMSSYPHIMSPSHSCVQDKVVYIVRHAQGQHNVSPSYDYDPPLTLEGHDQVWCLSAFLPPCIPASLPPCIPTSLPTSLPLVHRNHTNSHSHSHSHPHSHSHSQSLFHSLSLPLR